jgi:hypothetical protein
MKNLKFKTENGDIHFVDGTGNHFVNDKCVNPLAKTGLPIGSTIPNESLRIKIEADENL